MVPIQDKHRFHVAPKPKSLVQLSPVHQQIPNPIPAFLLACLISVTVLPTSNADDDGGAPGCNPIEAPAEFLEQSQLFAGWWGELPVMEQEYVLLDEDVEHFSVFISRDRKTCGLPEDFDLEVLAPGTTLLDETQKDFSLLCLHFDLDADTQALATLSDAAARATQENDFDSGFRPVPAELRLQVSNTHCPKPIVVWQAKRQILPTPGQTGFELSPPRLFLAVLSPGKTRLLVTFAGNEMEHLLLSLPSECFPPTSSQR